MATWQGVGTGNWSNSLNWLFFTPPNSNTDASIGTGNATVDTLGLEARNVFLFGNRTVDAGFGGGLGVTGNFDIAFGSSLVVRNGGSVSASRYDVSGNLVVGGAVPGVAEASGTITGAVNLLSGGKLIFNTSNQSTFSNAISGAGSVEHNGSGANQFVTMSGTNTYTGSTTVNSGTVFVLAGNAIANTGAVVVNAPGTFGVLDSEVIGSLAGGGTVTLFNGRTLTTGGNNTDTTFSGVLSQSNFTAGITKTGTGTFTVSGVNTYSGVTTVSAGTLRIANDSALGTTAAGTTVSNGATLALTGVLTVAEAITLNGTGVGNGGALRNVSGNNVVDGLITLASATRINTDAGQVELNGNITGTGTNLTVGGTGITLIAGNITTGAGSLTVDATLAGGIVQLTGNNSFTGGTTVSSGSLQLLGGSALADGGALTVNSPGVVQVVARETVGALSGSGLIALQTTGALVAGGVAGTTTFSGQIIENGATGAFTKAGAGTLILSGANTYTGTTTVNAGVLNVTGSVASLSNVVNSTGTLRVDGASLDNSATVTLNGTGILDVAGDLEQIAGLISASATSSVTLGSNTLVLNGDGDGALTESTTFAGVISGTGGLIKTGTDIQVLSGTNTYTGSTTVAGGELHLNGGAAIVNTNAVVVNGGRLEVNAAETIGTLAGGAPGIVDLNANTLTIGGNATAGVQSTDFGGAIVGTGRLTKTGIDTQVLSGANTYSGVTTINDGILSLSGGASIADTGAVVVNAAGRLQHRGVSETIGSLAGSGRVEVATSSTLATGADNTNTTFSGVIESSSGNFAKTGTGTFTLSGANTYGAITTINNGTLALAGGGSIANSLELTLTAPGAIFDISAISGGGASVRHVSFQGGGTINLGGKSLVVTHANGDFGIGTINGGTGANALNVTMDAAAPSVSLAGLTFNTWTDGADTISITGNNGGNTITGSEGNDTIDGRFGLDVMNGGSGVDTMDVSFFGGNYNWNMATGLTNFVGETAVNFENAILGSGNDTIVGTTGANSIVGGAGADSLIGGVDLLVDTLTGGAGGDTFVLGTSLNDVIVEAAGSGGGIDTITSEISRSLVGFANVENLTLFGTTPISGTGNELANFITGNLGDNLLTGLLGNDTLVGGQGKDTLNGGAGKDLFTGGGGLDRFIFSGLSDSGTTFATRDVINTFAHGDKIDLSAIDARTNLADDQAFTFIGAAAFSGAAGQLRFDMNNISPTGVKAYLVQGDVNGDRVADFTLQIFTAPTVDRTGQPQVFDIFAFDFIL